MLGTLAFWAAKTIGFIALSRITNGVAAPIGRRLNRERNVVAVDATRPDSGAKVKEPAQSWTMVFGDILFGIGFWNEILPIVSEFIDVTNILGSYEALGLMIIGFIIKVLRNKSVTPVA